MLTDIHTHRRAPYPEGVISVSPAEFAPVAGQSYSVGIHPWSLAAGDPPDEVWGALEAAVSHPQVVAVGECGIDLLKGGPLFRQLNVFRRHVDLSEAAGKPLVVHCVRAHDHIAQLRREIKPAQPWTVHGFRGKPSIARILLDAGLYISLGEKFNADSLSVIPAGRLLAETDESPESIGTVITSIAAAAGVPADSQRETIAANTARFLSLG